MFPLPAELLLSIFHHFKKLSHLAECRLVCSAWREPAERAMLEYTIVIPLNEAKMRSLHAFLQVDPKKANLVKQLQFGYNISLDSVIAMELLQLLLTPNIESITGYVCDANFINFLMNIKLDNLKTLILPCTEGEHPLELALHCKESVQTMELDLVQFSFVEGEGIDDWRFINRLNEFHHLTTFNLTAVIETTADLSKIIDNCPHLRELTLTTHSWRYDLDDGYGLNQIQTIKKHRNLKTLNIGFGDCSSCMVEYLLYKLVNLETICIHTPVNDSFTSEEEIVRIPQLIQKVPQNKLIYTVVAEGNARKVLAYLKRAGFTIAVQDVNASFDVLIKVAL